MCDDSLINTIVYIEKVYHVPRVTYWYYYYYYCFISVLLFTSLTLLSVTTSNESNEHCEYTNICVDYIYTNYLLSDFPSLEVT